MKVAVLMAALLLPVAAWAQGAAPSSEAPQEDPREVVGAPRGTAVSEAALDARTEEVGSLLRCPVCQGNSIADSPAAMAKKMKARVREMLAAGYDEEQILSYFERSYGEFVRLEPTRRGINWLVWLAPPFAFAGGLLLIRKVFIKPGGAVVAPPGPPARSAEMNSASRAADPSLEPYLLRVRELAYGWPGGRPPADTP